MGGWVVVAHVILVSAQVPLVLTLGLWTLGLRTWLDNYGTESKLIECKLIEVQPPKLNKSPPKKEKRRIWT